MFTVMRAFRKVLTMARATLAVTLFVATLAATAPAQASLIGLNPTYPDLTAFLGGADVQKSGTEMLGSPNAGLTVNSSFALLALNLNQTQAQLFGAGFYFLTYNVNSQPNSFSLLDLSGNTLLAGAIVKAGDLVSEQTETYDFLVHLSTVAPVLQDCGFGEFAGITLGPTGGNFSSDIFNVPTPVPEPGSLALVALGLAGIAALRRRNR